MKNGIILAAFMAALCTSAETVKTATQPWVRSYVATNRTDVSGKADATNVYTKAEVDARIIELAPTPGDYANVSNRAMSAIQEHQSLWPAVAASTNYTDAALGAFASTGAVARATVYGTPTRWTDASGDVWEIVSGWHVYINGVAAIGWLTYSYTADSGPEGDYVQLCIRPTEESEENGYPITSTNFPAGAAHSWNEEYETHYTYDYDYYGLSYGDSIRILHGGTNHVGRVALTNDIPDVSGYTTPADVTATIREQSLGGIYDDELGVWWTPHMSGGAYYWTATTNVNLSAEGNQ